MIIIYEQNYEENPIILDAIDDNIFEEYCRYYFDNILEKITSEIYIFKDFEYNSIKINDREDGGCVTWTTNGVMKSLEDLTEESKNKINSRVNTLAKYPDVINTSRSFVYLKIKNLNNFKQIKWVRTQRIFNI